MANLADDALDKTAGELYAAFTSGVNCLVCTDNGHGEVIYYSVLLAANSSSAYLFTAFGDDILRFMAESAEAYPALQS